MYVLMLVVSLFEKRIWIVEFTKFKLLLVILILIYYSNLRYKKIYIILNNKFVCIVCLYLINIKYIFELHLHVFLLDNKIKNFTYFSCILVMSIILILLASL